MDPYLPRLPFFKGLDAERSRRAARGFFLRRYSRGEAIFCEGEPAQAAYLLRSGLVKAVKLSPRARPVILEIIVPGHFFGMMPVLDRKPYPLDAVCLQDCELYRVGAKDFSELMALPPFSQAVYGDVGEHLRHSQALRALAKEPAPRRIAYILWLLSSRIGPELRLGREEIADMAATTVETAIRVLGRLREEGLVEARWKRIKVLKPQILRGGVD
ncbi:MAG: Crp/Fnr family transcriptional regulator [Elusimicrobia bacterium]|nr:Crp/Fnr family transcriptional regulator [Elusimicrobiota bacterium]